MEDEIIAESDVEEFNKYLKKHKRRIIPALVGAFLGVIIILGYGFYAIYMCSEIDGFLDSNFRCHLNYTEPMPVNIRESVSSNIVMFNLTNTTLDLENG